MVTGTIALLCQARTTLKTKPHVVKAILAASSGQYITADAKFKEVGAGLINANLTLEIAVDAYTYGTISSTAKTCSIVYYFGCKFENSEVHSESAGYIYYIY